MTQGPDTSNPDPFRTLGGVYGEHVPVGFGAQGAQTYANAPIATGVPQSMVKPGMPQPQQ
jgi:hypothetical protein